MDKLFDGRNEYKSKQPMNRSEITEFYTSMEVQEKYGISNSALFEMANREKWPKSLSRGKTLWSKDHVDRYFTKRNHRKTSLNGTLPRRFKRNSC